MSAATRIGADVAVIGAGLAGLTTAWRLDRAGVDVVLEAKAAWADACFAPRRYQRRTSGRAQATEHRPGAAHSTMTSTSKR
jgi:cation diffusion facilitator CzcD-associated flavoprotein CzcO